MLIGISCVATLGGKEYQSADYLIHTTGKKHNIICIDSKGLKGSSGVPAKMLRIIQYLNFSSYKNTTGSVQIFELDLMLWLLLKEKLARK